MKLKASVCSEAFFAEGTFFKKFSLRLLGQNPKKALIKIKALTTRVKWCIIICTCALPHTNKKGDKICKYSIKRRKIW
jgi:hypothetical protein